MAQLSLKNITSVICWPVATNEILKMPKSCQLIMLDMRKSCQVTSSLCQSGTNLCYYK